MSDEFGRADYEWRVGQESFVALSAAAAMAFHEAQDRSTRAILSPHDHDDALNIAASALSRLVAIYVVDEATRTCAVVKLDVVNGKFVRGGTEFRRHDGSTVSSMTVKRADLTSALSLIKRTGIPFSLAMGEATRSPTPAGESKAAQKK